MSRLERAAQAASSAAESTLAMLTLRAFSLAALSAPIRSRDASPAHRDHQLLLGPVAERSPVDAGGDRGIGKAIEQVRVGLARLEEDQLIARLQRAGLGLGLVNRLERFLGTRCERIAVPGLGAPACHLSVPVARAARERPDRRGRRPSS
jgi:hypothetical protein